MVPAQVVGFSKKATKDFALNQPLSTVPGRFDTEMIAATRSQRSMGKDALSKDETSLE